MDTKKPLLGKKIVITRDTKQSQNIVRKINSLGGVVVSFPTLKIMEPESWKECDESILNLKKYSWIIFTSANGVKYFLDRLTKFNSSLDGLKIAAVGEKTKDLLMENGYTVSVVPDNYSAGGLVHAFKNFDIKSKKILLPTSDIAKKHFYNSLIERGAEVTFVTVYKTVPNDNLSVDEILKAINSNQTDCLTFFSPSAFRFFIQILGETVLEKIEQFNIAVAAIGQTTAKEIEKFGLTAGIIPQKSSDESMIEAISDFFRKRQVNNNQ